MMQAANGQLESQDSVPASPAERSLGSQASSSSSESALTKTDALLHPVAGTLYSQEEGLPTFLSLITCCIVLAWPKYQGEGGGGVWNTAICPCICICTCLAAHPSVCLRVILSFCLSAYFVLSLKIN